MDFVYDSEHVALAVLRAQQLKNKREDVIPPQEIEKFHLNLGNHDYLKNLVILKFDFKGSENNALILSLQDFSVVRPTKNPGNISDVRMIVHERAIKHSDLSFLKGNKEKDFDPRKLNNYAVFIPLRIRNPVSMFISMRIEFEYFGTRVFFKKQYK